MRTSVPLFAGALTLLSLAGREVLANPVRDRDSIGVAKRDVLKRDEGDVLPVPEPTAPPRVGIAERQIEGLDLGDLAGLAKGAAGYISDNPGIVTFAQEHQDLIPVVLGVLAGKEKGQVTAQTSTLPDGSVMTVTNTLAPLPTKTDANVETTDLHSGSQRQTRLRLTLAGTGLFLGAVVSAFL